MDNLYDKIEQLGKDRGFDNITILCKAAGVSRAVMSELKSGRTSVLSVKNASKLATTLDVPIGMILEDNNSLVFWEMVSEDNRLSAARDFVSDIRQRSFNGSDKSSESVSEEDLKAAFWGGDQDLSKEDINELWEDVRDYARYKAEQKKRKK